MFQTNGGWERTLNHDILDATLFRALLAAALPLFAELGKDQGPYALDDPGQYRAARIEQP